MRLNDFIDELDRIVRDWKNQSAVVKMREGDAYMDDVQGLWDQACNEGISGWISDE